MNSKHSIVYVGSNFQVLEYLTQRHDIEIRAAYFQPDHSYTHFLVTICELRGIPYVGAADSFEVWADLQHREPADLGICCYFEILKEEVFTHPRGGFINVHPSLLPHYKGRTPWFHLLKNNEPSCGVTLHTLTQKTDAGVILAQQAFPVGFSDNYEDLKNKTNEAIKTLLDAHLVDIIEGKLDPTPNNESHYFKGIRSRQAFAWDDDPVQIYNLIRTQCGYGGCPVQYRGQEVGIVEAFLDLHAGHPNVAPGTICKVDESTLIVALRDGKFLRVTQWLPADLHFEAGTRLENLP
jgi:methionyl-tRNA formyltransferase